MLLGCLDHAEQHYRTADGNPTDEIRHIKTACRYVCEVYGAIRSHHSWVQDRQRYFVSKNFPSGTSMLFLARNM